MTSDQDAAAAAAIRAHHLELEAGLRHRGEALREAVRLEGDQALGGHAAASRDELLAYLRTELLPHAAAEERTLYRAAARGPAALLVQAMVEEHGRLLAEVDGLAEAESSFAAAWSSAAIVALFEAHLWKENELLVPALAADPATSLAGLLEGMEEIVGQSAR